MSEPAYHWIFFLTSRVSSPFILLSDMKHTHFRLTSTLTSLGCYARQAHAPADGRLTALPPLQNLAAVEWEDSHLHACLRAFFLNLLLILTLTALTFLSKHLTLASLLRPFWIATLCPRNGCADWSELRLFVLASHASHIHHWETRGVTRMTETSLRQ